MLARLDKVDGVASAMTNRSGTLIRVVVAPAAKPEVVATELETILGEQGRKPRQLSAGEAGSSASSEEWRTSDRVRELSEIEFRTVFRRRVLNFIQAQDVPAETAARLTSLADEVLQETSADEDTNWANYRGRLVELMLEKVKPVLSTELQRELKDLLTQPITG